MRAHHAVHCSPSPGTGFLDSTVVYLFKPGPPQYHQCSHIGILCRVQWGTVTLVIGRCLPTPGAHPSWTTREDQEARSPAKHGPSQPAAAEVQSLLQPWA